MTPLLRPTVERVIVSGFKHVLVLLFALALFVAGSAILYANMHALTIPLLITIAAFYGVSLLLAIPTDFKQVIVFVMPYLPTAVLGGRRRDDPPAPRELELPPPDPDKERHP